MGEAVVEQRGGIAPFIRGIENGEEEFVSVLRNRGGVGVAGGVGPTGLGGAHAGIDAEEFVVVFEGLAAGGGLEVVTLRAGDAAQFGDVDEGLKDFHEILGSGVLAGGGQTVGGLEAGIATAEADGAGIHHADEVVEVAANVTAQGAGGIVVGAEEKGVGEVADGDGFAGDERDVAGFGLVGGDDGDGAAEALVFVHEQGGEKFDRAGGGEVLFLVTGVEDFAGFGVDEEGALGADDLVDVALKGMPLSGTSQHARHGKKHNGRQATLLKGLFYGKQHIR